MDEMLNCKHRRQNLLMARGFSNSAHQVSEEFHRGGEKCFWPGTMHTTYSHTHYYTCTPHAQILITTHAHHILLTTHAYHILTYSLLYCVHAHQILTYSSLLCAIGEVWQHTFGPDTSQTSLFPIKVNSHDNETLLMVGIRNKYFNICRYISRL
jgi:hypothetical protein